MEDDEVMNNLSQNEPESLWEKKKIWQKMTSSGMLEEHLKMLITLSPNTAQKSHYPPGNHHAIHL